MKARSVAIGSILIWDTWLTARPMGRHGLTLSCYFIIGYDWALGKGTTTAMTIGVISRAITMEERLTRRGIRDFIS